MTRLSVNVNKIATLRNARGGNNPDLIQVVKDCRPPIATLRNARGGRQSFTT